mgnify:FL=1
MIICSSKNKNKLTSNGLDISQIKDIFNTYFLPNGYKLIFCFIVKNKKQIDKIIKNSKKSSEYLVNTIKDTSTIIIDWTKLCVLYDDFYIKFKNKKLSNITLSNKKTLNLRFHQKLSINRTMKLLLHNDKILWGHIPRSGKSYIMAGTIFRDSNNKNICNYLIVTSVPNETINQYFSIFENYSDFHNINCFRLNSNKKPKLYKKNIIICSIQFLYKKNISWLHKLKIDLTICDESHHGLTAELSSKKLKYHGSKKFIYITATYSKPSKHFNISKECHILWDFEDINLCKKINEKDSYLKLIQKYNCKKLIKLYGLENIKNTYIKFPELHILTTNFKDNIFNDILNMKEHGYSIQSLLLLKNNKDKIFNNFMKPNELLKFCYYIFGKKSKYKVSISTISIMSRIKKITERNNSRFISEKNPLVILCFLPCGGNSMSIDKVSKCFSFFLEKHLDKFEYKFDTVVINSKTTNNPKELIDNKIRTTDKKIILVLSGRQCSMGVTIELCDIVMLFNDTQSLDMAQQMMFRSMSESKGKTCGFLVDLNVRRVSNLIVDYATKLYTSKSIKEGILKIYESRLVNINSDLNDVMKNNKDGSNKYLVNLRNNIYNIWCENPYTNIIGILNELNILNTDYPPNIQLLINKLQLECKKSKKTIKEKNIKDGIKVYKSTYDLSSDEDEEIKKEIEKKVDFKNIVKFFIPLICVLSIDFENYDFSEILLFIEKNIKLNLLLTNHLNECFNNINIYTTIMNILDKTDLINNDEIKRVTKIIKQLFIENKYNRKKLSKLFDNYLIPQEIEKKNNAEVSTPYELRKDMLDKIPIKFWKNPGHKVFEPCCGKSGFLLDIIDRFMEGLKYFKPNKKERYEYIVTNCLYYADINPINIYISELLLNPNKNLKLNYYEGNTLELNINEKFGLDYFDSIIGNPPYNDKSGNKGKNHTLWDKFILYSLNILKKKGYLLFVHPSIWRQINNKILNLYKNKQLLYIEIHNVKDGLKTFKCSTRYDWYLLENIKPYIYTFIRDENNILNKIHINEWDFIPNMYFTKIQKLLSNNNTLDVWRHRSTYSTEKKKLVSKEKNKSFKYPLVYSIKKNNTISLRYTNDNKKGHFGLSKFIFSNGAGFYCDIEGKYGLTEWAYCIYDKPENLKNIEKTFRSEKFNKIKKAIHLDSSTYNIKVMKLFKKDFWKDFI